VVAVELETIAVVAKLVAVAPRLAAELVVALALGSVEVSSVAVTILDVAVHLPVYDFLGFVAVKLAVVAYLQVALDFLAAEEPLMLLFLFLDL